MPTKRHDATNTTERQTAKHLTKKSPKMGQNDLC